MSEFNCTQCGARLSLPTANPGQAVRCGHCGQPTVVPGGPAATQSAPYPTPPAFPNTPPTYPNYLNTQPAPSNGLAVAALVCGILGFCCVPVSIAAIVCGFMALNKKTPGRGMAIAGIVLGIVSVILNIAYFVFMIFASAVGAGANP